SPAVPAAASAACACLLNRPQGQPRGDRQWGSQRLCSEELFAWLHTIQWITDGDWQIQLTGQVTVQVPQQGTPAAKDHVVDRDARELCTEEVERAAHLCNDLAQRLGHLRSIRPFRPLGRPLFPSEAVA